MKLLLRLSNWFDKNNFKKLSQEVKELNEYAEPWHQEAVEEFGDEIIPESEEQLLNKQVLDAKKLKIPFFNKSHKETFQRIADDEGFKIVESSKSFLAGQGGFGTVLRGVYKGKPAVAKIILGNSGEQEVNNWNTILNASKNSIPELKKYLPNIYECKFVISYNGDNDDDYYDYDYDYDNENNYAIIIMEELLPINIHLQNQIFGITSKGVFDLAKDPELLWNLAEKYTKELTEVPLNLKRQDVFKWLLDSDFKDIKDDYMMTSDLPGFFSSQIQKKIKSLNPDISPKITSNVYFNINRVGSDFFLHHLPPDYISALEDEMGEYFDFLPETKGLMKALKQLAKISGLGWQDLYIPKNLMMDRDGNLKIIDVGLYVEL